MKEGNYKNVSIDIGNYSCPLFNFYMPQFWNEGSCGENAFYTLTNKWPECNDPDYLPSWEMVELLVKQGLWVFELTKSGVTNHISIQNHIKRNHILLINQRFNKRENSWQVIHKNQIFHNFQIMDLNPLELVNRPIEKIYVIFNPIWNCVKYKKRKLPKNKWNLV